MVVRLCKKGGKGNGASTRCPPTSNEARPQLYRQSTRRAPSTTPPVGHRRTELGSLGSKHVTLAGPLDIPTIPSGRSPRGWFVPISGRSLRSDEWGWKAPLERPSQLRARLIRQSSLANHGRRPCSGYSRVSIHSCSPRNRRMPQPQPNQCTPVLQWGLAACGCRHVENCQER